MLRTFLLKLASLFYRVYALLYRLGKRQTSFVPYRLHYRPSHSPVKIVHINGNFIIGGTSQLIVDIIERTSDRYTHEIIVPSYPDPLPYQPVSIHSYSLYQMDALLQFLKEARPVLVHIHYWVRQQHKYEPYALWYGAVFNICEELNLKVIQNINVPTQPYLSKAILHNVFVSRYVLKHFNNSTTPASVFYPGSDFRHFKNEAIDALPDNSIGMVYRLDKDKLNAAAIDVFIAVVRKRQALRCYIIGEGDYFEHYRKRVEEEQLDGNFIFTGMVSYSQLPAYYKKFSVFIAPVHDESFGQVTPFAMSMGLCVAGYDTGALSEILGSKDTLVDYGNIAALADVIVGLVDDPERRRRLGKQNQQRAHAQFSVEQMIAQYRDLYAAVTA